MSPLVRVTLERCSSYPEGVQKIEAGTADLVVLEVNPAQSGSQQESSGLFPYCHLLASPQSAQVLTSRPEFQQIKSYAGYPRFLYSGDEYAVRSALAFATLFLESPDTPSSPD